MTKPRVTVRTKVVVITGLTEHVVEVCADTFDGDPIFFCPICAEGEIPLRQAAVAPDFVLTCDKCSATLRLCAVRVED